MRVKTSACFLEGIAIEGESTPRRTADISSDVPAAEIFDRFRHGESAPYPRSDTFCVRARQHRVRDNFSKLLLRKVSDKVQRCYIGTSGRPSAYLMELVPISRGLAQSDLSERLGGL
jgi:hypothetical protein